MFLEIQWPWTFQDILSMVKDKLSHFVPRTQYNQENKQSV